MARHSYGLALHTHSQERLSYPSVVVLLRCTYAARHFEQACMLTIVQIFGRRIVILSSLTIMALGSALCGSAKTMTHLIAGRSGLLCLVLSFLVR